jgi:hypothetical protein
MLTTPLAFFTGHPDMKCGEGVSTLGAKARPPILIEEERAMATFLG